MTKGNRKHKIDTQSPWSAALSLIHMGALPGTPTVVTLVSQLGSLLPTDLYSVLSGGLKTLRKIKSGL